MFRTAAVVYLLLGASAIWRFGFTPYDPAHRPWGVGVGLLAAIVGVFLLRRARWAIALSAIGAAIVAMAAAVAAPEMHGPVILAFAGVAIMFGLYSALAGRVLLEPRS
jgi:hypothetical protein